MTIVEQKLRKIVTETFLIGGESGDLLGDDSFIEKGIIDSTGILQLVEFVEQEFGIKVDDEDLIPENLDSINRLVAFVEEKLLLSSAGTGQGVTCSPSTVACPIGAASLSSD
jgi:acyl carrier protein